MILYQSLVYVINVLVAMNLSLGIKRRPVFIRKIVFFDTFSLFNVIVHSHSFSDLQDLRTSCLSKEFVFRSVLKMGRINETSKTANPPPSTSMIPRRSSIGNDTTTTSSQPSKMTKKPVTISKTISVPGNNFTKTIVKEPKSIIPFSSTPITDGCPE